MTNIGINDPILCIQAASDRIFGYGGYKSVQLHSQFAPTYSGLYGYQAQPSLLALAGKNPRGNAKLSQLVKLDLY